MTYKFGKFYFIHEYVDHKTIDGLLMEAKVLHDTIIDLPILPDLASRLEPELLYSSIEGTAAIENNPISAAGVEQIANKKNIEGYTQKHKQEITNLLLTYELLSKVISEALSEEKTSGKVKYHLREETIRSFHKLVTFEVPHEHNVPGNYRNGKVEVGSTAHGGVYKPPKILEDVKNLMKEFIKWINSDEILSLDPLIRATLAHYHFSLIHPFWDGNGRTARLLETVILEANGIKYVPKMLANIYYQNVDDYYIAYSKTIKLQKENDVSPFLEFVLKSVVEALKKLKKEITNSIRLLAVNDSFRMAFEKKEITKRQYQFLLLLPNNQGPFRLKDLRSNPVYATLYSNVSEQTARRDLKKFFDKKYLIKDEDGLYRFNIRFLG